MMQVLLEEETLGRHADTSKCRGPGAAPAAMQDAGVCPGCCGMRVGESTGGLSGRVTPCCQVKQPWQSILKDVQAKGLGAWA